MLQPGGQTSKYNKCSTMELWIKHDPISDLTFFIICNSTGVLLVYTVQQADLTCDSLFVLIQNNFFWQYFGTLVLVVGGFTLVCYYLW